MQAWLVILSSYHSFNLVSNGPKQVVLLKNESGSDRQLFKTDLRSRLKEVFPCDSWQLRLLVPSFGAALSKKRRDKKIYRLPL